MNLYLKRSAFALLILLLILLVYVLIVPQGESTTDTTDRQEEAKTVTSATVGLSVGNIPPDIPLVGVNGDQMNLSDLKGQKIFLNFWATWCPPCRAEMPDIEQMKEKYGDDLAIVAINNAEAKRVVTGFLEDYPYTFNVYLDENATISRMYQLISIPTSYFIDEEGIIQKKITGSLDFEQMEGYYNSL